MENEEINAAFVKKKKEKKHDYKAIRFSCMVYKLDLTAIPRVAKGSLFRNSSLIDIVELGAKLRSPTLVQIRALPFRSHMSFSVSSFLSNKMEQ